MRLRPRIAIFQQLGDFDRRAIGGDQAIAHLTANAADAGFGRFNARFRPSWASGRARYRGYGTGRVAHAQWYPQHIRNKVMPMFPILLHMLHMLHLLLKTSERRSPGLQRLHRNVRNIRNRPPEAPAGLAADPHLLWTLPA